MRSIALALMALARAQGVWLRLIASREGCRLFPITHRSNSTSIAVCSSARLPLPAIVVEEPCINSPSKMHQHQRSTMERCLLIFWLRAMSKTRFEKLLRTLDIQREAYEITSNYLGLSLGPAASEVLERGLSEFNCLIY